MRFYWHYKVHKTFLFYQENIPEWQMQILKTGYNLWQLSISHMFSDVVTALFSLFLYSISGCIRPDLYDWSNEKNCSQRWLFWTLPGHLAKLHESHSCRQHQLRGLRVHEERLGNLQMMLEVGREKPNWLEEKSGQENRRHAYKVCPAPALSVER